MLSAALGSTDPSPATQPNIAKHRRHVDPTPACDSSCNGPGGEPRHLSPPTLTSPPPPPPSPPPPPPSPDPPPYPPPYIPPHSPPQRWNIDQSRGAHGLIAKARPRWEGRVVGGGRVGGWWWWWRGRLPRTSRPIDAPLLRDSSGPTNFSPPSVPLQAKVPASQSLTVVSQSV